jgi:hypothetical protein
MWEDYFVGKKRLILGNEPDGCGATRIIIQAGKPSWIATHETPPVVDDVPSGTCVWF